MLPTDLRSEFVDHGVPHNETFNITYRYCDVSDLAGYAGIEDLRITYDICYTDFKLYG